MAVNFKTGENLTPPENKENPEIESEKSEKKPRPKKVKNDPAFLAEKIKSLHDGLAAYTGFSELQLSITESTELASGLLEISKHYDVSIDPKVMAHLTFLTTAAMIYAPRAYLIYAQTKQAKVQNANQVELND